MVLSSIETPFGGPLWTQVRFRFFNQVNGELREQQVYQIVERSQDRLDLRQISGEGPFPRQLKLIRWQE